MKIANIGSAAAGMVRGYQTANEDRFLEEQRNRQRKEWEDKDALDKALKEVRPAGDYEETAPTFEGMTGGLDQQDIPLKRTTVSRSDADVLADQARVYQRQGKVKEGAELTGLARGERKGAREERITKDLDFVHREAGEMLSDLRTMGHVEFAKKYGGKFNLDQIGGADMAGAKVHFDPDFKRVAFVDKDGVYQGHQDWTPQSARQMVDDYLDQRLRGLSAESYATAEDRGLKRRQVGAAETTASAAMRNAGTMESYRRDQTGKPIVGQDGTGRLVALDSTGTRQLGVYGSARPDPAARGPKELSPGMVEQLNAAAAEVDAVMSDPKATAAQKQAAQVRYANMYRNAATTMGKVVAPRVENARPDIVMNDVEKLAIPKFLDIVGADPKMTGNQRAELARRMGIRPEVVGAQAIDYLAALQGMGAPGSSPKPAAAPAAAAPTATAPTAAASASGGPGAQLSTEQLLADLKKNGAVGFSERVLGPRPGARNLQGQRQWDAAEKDLIARVQQARAGMTR